MIALAVAAVLLVGRTPPAPPPDLGTPVGVVQAYVQAERAGDQDRARGLLSQSAQRELDKAPGRPPFAPANVERRIIVEPADVTGDRASVKVTVSTFTSSADPFSAGSYSNEWTVSLVRENGAWRINQPLDPFMFS